MNLDEARREGYIQALKDLYDDGILAKEEYEARKAAHMTVSY